MRPWKATGKAIALFENAGAVAKAAGTSLTLALDQAWHVEFAAATSNHRPGARAPRVGGPAATG